MIPREVAETVAAAMPTTPTKSDHRPKVMIRGTRFGIRLNAPSLTLPNAITMISAIKSTATPLPPIMSRILRSEM